MSISIRFGKPKRRVGVVGDNWIRTPDTNHFTKALPENAEWEIVRFYGIYIGNYFFGIQRFARKLDRQRDGHQFGPARNLLDIIMDPK